jgi:putative molybdopterin biosynthesis protein
MSRTIYLNMLPPTEAVERITAALDRETLVCAETIPAHEAAGRVTAAPVFARNSSPTYHSAAMDGIAVHAAETYTAREDEPLTLDTGHFARVNTGNPLPEGREFDAVIMIENVEELDDGTVRIEAPAFPWQNVRRIGEDIVATELLLPRNRLLTPYDAAALLTAGIFEVEVWEPIRFAVIPTGDEVLDFTRRPDPGPGQVIESNSVMLCGLAISWGMQAMRVPPVDDDPAAIADAARQALDAGAHVVVVCAGSSSGRKDFTKSVFEDLGEVVVHGIQAMPGKPSLLGVSRDGRMLVGAPGYPVSAAVCFQELVRPVVSWLSRKPLPRPPAVPAALTRKVPSRLGMEEHVRLAVGRVGDRNVATPLARAAGMITSLTEAQAIARIPASSEGVEQNEEVMAELLVPEQELARTLVVTGSHDNTLDLLADMLMGQPDPIRLVSTHVGSLGGIRALAQGMALAAGAHLFDPESSDFNFPFLHRHAPDLDVAVINLAIRQQGLIIAPGNPKAIGGVADLAQEDIRYVNRQRGAGTRILLDHQLVIEGVSASDVHGYDREEHTHMAVAVNVATGAADCGLGIYAAAAALRLDFIPVARERYDLLVPTFALDDPRIRALLAIIESDAFRRALEALGGYETALTGQRMAPGQKLG